jgi:hypothetical protein
MKAEAKLADVRQAKREKGNPSTDPSSAMEHFRRLISAGRIDSEPEG